MTFLASDSLWQAIYDRLRADVALMAEISGIYDTAPEGRPLPYITIGEGVVSDWSAKDFSGQDHLLDIHIWARGRGGGAVRGLADQVAALLSGADLSLTGHQLARLEFRLFENFFDSDGRVRHGVLRFRARTRQII
jgi:hypothetical protein|tara:strand:+ start:791 stop:1198 length:408 start_codon:yes stop_codon:yes gene_type:complete